MPVRSYRSQRPTTRWTSQEADRLPHEFSSWLELWDASAQEERNPATAAGPEVVHTSRAPGVSHEKRPYTPEAYAGQS